MGLTGVHSMRKEQLVKALLKAAKAKQAAAHRDRKSFRLGNAVKREYQVVVILTFENDIVACSDGIVDALRDQSLVAACDILTELGSAVHLVTLREVRADGEYTAVADSGTTQGRMLGCQRGCVE